MPAKVGSASDVHVGGGDRWHETDRAAGVADVHPEVDDLGTQLRGQVRIEDEAQTHARHPDPTTRPTTRDSDAPDNRCRRAPTEPGSVATQWRCGADGIRTRTGADLNRMPPAVGLRPLEAVLAPASTATPADAAVACLSGGRSEYRIRIVDHLGLDERRPSLPSVGSGLAVAVRAEEPQVRWPVVEEVAVDVVDVQDQLTRLATSARCRTPRRSSARRVCPGPLQAHAGRPAGTVGQHNQELRGCGDVVRQRRPGCGPAP